MRVLDTVETWDRDETQKLVLTCKGSMVSAESLNGAWHSWYLGLSVSAERPDMSRKPWQAFTDYEDCPDSHV